MSHRGNPYRKDGKFASSANYDSMIYTPAGDFKYNEYSVTASGGKKANGVVSEEELRDQQIQKQEEEARRLNEEEKRRDRQKQANRITKQKVIDAGGSITDKTTGNILEMQKWEMDDTQYTGNYLIWDKNHNLIAVTRDFNVAISYFRKGRVE